MLSSLPVPATTIGSLFSTLMVMRGRSLEGKLRPLLYNRKPL